MIAYVVSGYVLVFTSDCCMVVTLMCQACTTSPHLSLFLFFRASIARVHGSLGLVYELLRDTDRAIDHHQQVEIVL